MLPAGVKDRIDLWAAIVGCFVATNAVAHLKH
jgi:hypothetical protein